MLRHQQAHSETSFSSDRTFFVVGLPTNYVRRRLQRNLRTTAQVEHVDWTDLAVVRGRATDFVGCRESNPATRREVGLGRALLFGYRNHLHARARPRMRKVCARARRSEHCNGEDCPADIANDHRHILQRVAACHAASGSQFLSKRCVTSVAPFAQTAMRYHSGPMCYCHAREGPQKPL